MMGLYKIFQVLIYLVWIGDILNFQQLAFLDTTIPFNTLAWFLLFIFMPSSDGNNKVEVIADSVNKLK